MLLVLGSCAAPQRTPVDSKEQTIWSGDHTPTVLSDPDDRSVEVGTEFVSASDGVVTAVRFYQGPEDMGATEATIWSSYGMKIASSPIAPGAGGWREVRFTEPVPVEADRRYVVSYRASRGHYAFDPGTFAGGRQVRNEWLTALNGMFTDGNGLPEQSSDGKNYYVDVAFRPTGPSQRNVDGGDQFYGTFKDSFPTSSDFFPLGVWAAQSNSPEEIASDRALGLNTYVLSLEGSNDQLIKDSGMFTLPNTPSPNSAGELLTDEADMWAGAGDAPWTGELGAGSGDPQVRPCIPGDAKCGYTVMSELRKRVARDILTFANYGKGVTFWQTPEQASRFVNEFQDVVSADNYWFTDPNICQSKEGGVLKHNGDDDLSPADCRLAANYGLTTRHVRSLVQPVAAMPVWNFVELGHPFTEDESGTITPTEVRAAVWSSLIGGARGIVYFAHNFGGPCPSYNLLRDQCGDAIRTELTALNQQITRLAPVLNAPFLDGYARSDGPVDIAVKRHENSNYVMVGAAENEPFDATVSVSCGNANSAEVIDENRTVPITNHTFHDAFADGNAVHLYKIDGSEGCGLP
ncbi:MAG TPA: DUF4082 domain-containing protein [Ilumatobacteraceae bacterium]|nr:DUF4082 domain-containing protein [Ilumatobacteraceae bacterium]